MATRKVARPNRPLARNYSHVTREMIENILEDIKGGGTIKHSCEANRLTETMFREILEQGEYDLDENKFDTLEAYALGALRKIQLVDIKNSVNVIKEAARGHRGKEWCLERMHWRQFGANLDARDLADQVDSLKRSLRQAQARTQVTQQQLDKARGTGKGHYGRPLKNDDE